MDRQNNTVILWAPLGLFLPIIIHDDPLWRDFVIGAIVGAVIGYAMRWSPGEKK